MKTRASNLIVSCVDAGKHKKIEQGNRKEDREYGDAFRESTPQLYLNKVVKKGLSLREIGGGRKKKKRGVGASAMPGPHAPGLPVAIREAAFTSVIVCV